MLPSYPLVVEVTHAERTTRTAKENEDEGINFDRVYVLGDNASEVVVVILSQVIEVKGIVHQSSGIECENGDKVSKLGRNKRHFKARALLT